MMASMALFAGAVAVALLAMFVLGYFAAAMFGSVEVEHCAEPPDSDRGAFKGRTWEDSLREYSGDSGLLARNDTRTTKRQCDD